MSHLVQELFPNPPGQPVVPAISPGRLGWLLAVMLGLATLVLYWPATDCDFSNFDDTAYVTANVHVQRGLTVAGIKWAFTSVVCCNWHPLTMLSHMLDCQWHGLNPWGHHLTSVLLHAVNTSLLFLLLCRLTGARWRSFWVAALFACHPLHVESVAWVAERKDVLSTCFGFLTLMLYARYAREHSPGAPAPVHSVSGSPRPFYFSPSYWLACLCFAAGLMSKPMLVTWPFVLLLLDYWPLQRWQPGRFKPLLVEKIPFLVLSAAVCVMTVISQSEAGATRDFQHLPLGIRCANAIVSYDRYLLKLLWPVDLAVFYPHPGFWPLAVVFLAGTVFCALSFGAWWGRRRYPFLLMGWCWYVGTLVPVIGLLQVGSQAMADRYSYIPSVGLLILVVWGLCEIRRRATAPAWLWPAAGAGALLLCSLATRHQLGYWQNSETLFRHALAVTADNGLVRNNLGAAFLAHNQTNAAISQFQAALRLNPNNAEAHDNLGNILGKRGEFPAAMAELKTAIQLKPHSALAHNNLANVFVAAGQTSNAISQFQAALELDPDYASAHGNLAILLVQTGQTNEAVRQFQAALELQPREADTHFNYANLLAASRQTNAAIGEYFAALQIKPDDAGARYQLGTLLARQGRTDEAISQFQEVLRHQPDFWEAHNNLGTLLNAKDRVDEAIPHFQAAIRLKPDFFDAQYNLGNAFFKKGLVDETITQYQAVIRLAPDFAPARFYLGVVLLKKGLPEDAARQLQEAIRIKPDYALAHNKLGVVLGGQGKWGDAIREFQAALSYRPGYAEASNNLARALEMNGAAPKP